MGENNICSHEAKSVLVSCILWWGTWTSGFSGLQHFVESCFVVPALGNAQNSNVRRVSTNSIFPSLDRSSPTTDCIGHCSEISV